MPRKRSLVEIEQRHGELIDAITGEYEDRLSSVVARASAAIVSWLRETLEVDADGRVLPSEANRRVLGKLAERFRAEMNRRGLAAANRWLADQMPGQVTQFREVLEFINANLKQPLPEIKFGELDEAALRNVQVTAREQLDGVAADVGQIAQRRALMHVGVSNYRELTDTLADTFRTTIPKALTLANTSLSIYRRTVTERAVEVMERGGREVVFRYGGPHDKLTRPFCRKLLDLGDVTFTRAEIEKMDNGQLPNPFLTGGGYNCRHQWLVAGYRETQKPKAAAKKWKLLDDEQERDVQRAQKVGPSGVALRVDGEAVEDQDALVFEQWRDDQPETVVRLKLRPEHEKALLDALRLEGGQGVAPRLVGGRMAARLRMEGFDEPEARWVEERVIGMFRSGRFDDSLFDDVKRRFGVSALVALKTRMSEIVGEAAPGVWPKASAVDEDLLRYALNDWKVGGELEQFIRLRTPEEQAILRREVSEWIGRRVQAVADAWRELEKRGGSPLKGATVRRGAIEIDEREIRDGKLFVVNGNTTLTNLQRGSAFSYNGTGFVAEFQDGVRLRYVPWEQERDVHYAFRGSLEVVAPGRAEAGRVDAVLDRVGQVTGVRMSAPTPAEREWMYLQKHAYMAKLDDSDGWKAVASAPTVEERVERGRQFWASRLGVKDVTKLAAYDPLGVRSSAALAPGEDAGWWRQYRFDLSPEQLRREMGGYTVYHQITNGNGVVGFVEAAMKGTGGLASTVEKVRAGVPVGGMSPDADSGTGGASYVFTRIFKMGRPRHGIYFKIDVLRRLDAISYSRDNYGRVVGDFVRRNRYSTPAEWKEYCATSSSNETIFKHSLSLLDDVDMIVVRSDEERRRVIEAFRRAGHERMSDGRKIEDCVKVAGE